MQQIISHQRLINVNLQGLITLADRAIAILR